MKDIIFMENFNGDVGGVMAAVGLTWIFKNNQAQENGPRPLNSTR